MAKYIIIALLFSIAGLTTAVVYERNEFLKEKASMDEKLSQVESDLRQSRINNLTLEESLRIETSEKLAAQELYKKAMEAAKQDHDRTIAVTEHIKKLEAYIASLKAGNEDTPNTAVSEYEKSLLKQHLTPSLISNWNNDPSIMVIGRVRPNPSESP